MQPSGEILIDNHNIKDLDLKFLRKNVGAVSQEPALFAGSISDNMKVGKMDAEDEEIQKAAVMANAHTFISQLPDQYSTEVSYSIHIPELTENLDYGRYYGNSYILTEMGYR